MRALFGASLHAIRLSLLLFAGLLPAAPLQAQTPSAAGPFVIGFNDVVLVATATAATGKSDWLVRGGQ